MQKHYGGWDDTKWGPGWEAGHWGQHDGSTWKGHGKGYGGDCWSENHWQKGWGGTAPEIGQGHHAPAWNDAVPDWEVHLSVGAKK